MSCRQEVDQPASFPDVQHVFEEALDEVDELEELLLEEGLPSSVVLRLCALLSKSFQISMEMLQLQS